MSNETSLAKLSSAVTALAEAKTLSEVKQIIDMAEAARVWAVAAKLGREATNHATEIKLMGARKAGEFLKIMEKNKGSQGQLVSRGVIGGNMVVTANNTPTLAEIGITKAQSSQWQKIAAIPEQVFEEHVAQSTKGQKELTTAATLKLAKSIAYQKKDAERAEVTSSLPPTVKLYHGDFREQCQQIPDNSIDFILTDPPYIGDAVSLWEPLAEMAARVLKPGGYLFAYSGQMFLIEVANQLGRHLTYQWAAAVQHKQGFTRIWKHDLLNAWKPILIYSKGKPGQTLHGMVDLIGLGQGDKVAHEWAQPEAEAAYYIKYVTLPGQTVLDPFMGSGSVITAAHKQNRCAIGCEIDEQHYRTVRSKLEQSVSSADNN